MIIYYSTAGASESDSGRDLFREGQVADLLYWRRSAIWKVDAGTADWLILGWWSAPSLRLPPKLPRFRASPVFLPSQSSFRQPSALLHSSTRILSTGATPILASRTHSACDTVEATTLTVEAIHAQICRDETKEEKETIDASLSLPDQTSDAAAIAIARRHYRRIATLWKRFESLSTPSSLNEERVSAPYILSDPRAERSPLLFFAPPKYNFATWRSTSHARRADGILGAKRLIAEPSRHRQRDARLSSATVPRLPSVVRAFGTYITDTCATQTRVFQLPTAASILPYIPVDVPLRQLSCADSENPGPVVERPGEDPDPIIWTWNSTIVTKTRLRVFEKGSQRLERRGGSGSAIVGERFLERPTREETWVLLQGPREATHSTVQQLNTVVRSCAPQPCALAYLPPPSISIEHPRPLDNCLVSFSHDFVPLILGVASAEPVVASRNQVFPSTEMAHRQSGGYKEEPGVAVAGDHPTTFASSALSVQVQGCWDSARGGAGGVASMLSGRSRARPAGLEEGRRVPVDRQQAVGLFRGHVSQWTGLGA
ncbi:hypothetical protein G7Y89_g9855 [Cudoniella acicularis]|uniref:Uncharacterized protein n=1 Tax=Cudoniella acicularis TaxID=354080 RepID=A0A8H4RDV2_9HELO|nr:hypothetical protein G7Y89_g9855 [Cudoniella acicularis]